MAWFETQNYDCHRQILVSESAIKVSGEFSYLTLDLMLMIALTTIQVSNKEKLKPHTILVGAALRNNL